MITSAGDISLRQEQIDALDDIDNGSVLVGGVGSGKTFVSIFWYINTAPDKHLYVITTAANRDMIKAGHKKPDWHESIEACGVSPDMYTVDSWNNVKKYEKVKDAVFIFDEQRVVGYGTWGKAFIKIAKYNNNHWILTSATPGDVWMDWLCIFIANGFFLNKTDFTKNHVEWNPYTPFPTVQRYKGTAALEAYRSSVVVQMGDKRKTKRHKNIVMTVTDRDKYNSVVKDRYNFLTDMPIQNASEFTQLLRRVCGTSDDRIAKFKDLMVRNKKTIIFYNYNYERDIIIDVCRELGRTYGEWNGNSHTMIPEGDEWAYIVQYNGAEGWNCITTDTMIFYSVNYSYRKMEQAEGRIDRINTPYRDLYYHYLTSSARVDVSVMQAVAKKKKFNESMFARNQYRFIKKED